MNSTCLRHDTRRAALVAALALFCLAPALAGAAAVGEPAPDFTLTGHRRQAARARGPARAAKHLVVLEWFNPDCPFILKHHQHHRTMDDLAARYREQGVVWLAINSGRGRQAGCRPRAQPEGARRSTRWPSPC